MLLSLLAQKDIYGYEIIQHSRLSGDYLQYKEGMLYADL
ncbi:helix-turn-helix transcriptional regulator [Peribacillus sp. Bi134]|nr:helix-turn-helix transcriptional regulator [Peribacillus sp. Bi134]